MHAEMRHQSQVLELMLAAEDLDQKDLDSESSRVLLPCCSPGAGRGVAARVSEETDCHEQVQAALAILCFVGGPLATLTCHPGLPPPCSLRIENLLSSFCPFGSLASGIHEDQKQRLPFLQPLLSLASCLQRANAKKAH